MSSEEGEGQRERERERKSGRYGNMMIKITLLLLALSTCMWWHPVTMYYTEDIPVGR